MLSGKTVVVGICGGIAAYKMCDVVHSLRKLNAQVFVIMTNNATQFITPKTLETLSNNRVVFDMFANDYDFNVEHISLAKRADIFVIAPATANFIGKMANGIADDMLSTTVMATKAPILICPAMNTNMYENTYFEKNLTLLRENGVLIMPAEEGLLACGDVGKGRLPSPDSIVNTITEILIPNLDFVGKNILITAGATMESIDKVRYITNHSSGKMGVELCKSAVKRGANVTLVYGNISQPVPQNVKAIKVTTTQQMYQAVMGELDSNDIIIKAAAPSDYSVENFSEQKIKAKELTLKLKKNIDIAKQVGENKGNIKLIIFSAETENLIENAKEKLINKNADLVVANDVTARGAGFNCDTNIVSIINRQGEVFNYGINTKQKVADIILDNILKLV